MPSSARAAMMPAIAVPCHSATSRRPSTKFRATATRPVRSGWLTSTPVSISATRTRLPVVILCSSSRCQSLALGCSGYNGSLCASTSEQLHRLRRFDARIQRQFFHDLRQRHIARGLHDETVDTESSHRPAVDDLQAVLRRKPFGNSPPRIASGTAVVAAGVARVGTKVRCRQAQQDQDLPFERIAIDRESPLGDPFARRRRRTSTAAPGPRCECSSSGALRTKGLDQQRSALGLDCLRRPVRLPGGNLEHVRIRLGRAVHDSCSGAAQNALHLRFGGCRIEYDDETSRSRRSSIPRHRGFDTEPGRRCSLEASFPARRSPRIQPRSPIATSAVCGPGTGAAVQSSLGPPLALPARGADCERQRTRPAWPRRRYRPRGVRATTRPHGGSPGIRQGVAVRMRVRLLQVFRLPATAAVRPRPCVRRHRIV